MRQVKISELKDHLSEHLRAVEAGDEVVITDRGRPIARLLPFMRPGGLEIIPAETPFSEIRDRVNEPAGWPSSSLELLLEDRRKQR